MSEKRKLDKEKLHRLMYTLFYPAVLGTLFMLIVLGGFNKEKIQIGFAMFLALYFSVQHIQNNDNSDKDYMGLDFIFDILELASMFFLFYLLGITESVLNPQWCAFYLVLIFSFFIPILTRIFKQICYSRSFDKNDKELSSMSLIAMLIGLFNIILPFENVRIISLALLFLMFVFYSFFYVLFTKPK
ncbi:hypothetical protein [Hwangdonia seohaensis]|uniref:Uncharacterized protein n=1 Tax=Hwangdonia seohaensis TaxID=1240727 RepID=A0ABW3RAH5_9FLAO|nr:hypothetical protein [Hwangdonia seohaensis]